MKKPPATLIIGLVLILAAFGAYSWSLRRAEAARRLQAKREAAAAAANQAMGQYAEDELARLSEGGNVEVSAVFLNPLRPEEKDLAFEIFFTTHSGSVADSKLEDLATVTTDSGEKLAKDFSWTAESDDAHHRYGILRVKALTADGKPVITASTGQLTLELRDIGGIKRTFTWEKKYLTDLVGSLGSGK
ncbi:MAG: hypothetical protein ACYC6I_11610 [Bacillota bacterium]